MSTLFSKIAAGEIPSYKCAENDKFFAFLDINPVAPGHTLVIPRQEIDYIFDMSDEDIAAFQVFATKVARALKQAFPCRKVGQAVIGLEVNHADIDFKHHVKMSEDELKAASEKIQKAFQQL